MLEVGHTKLYVQWVRDINWVFDLLYVFPVYNGLMNM